MNHNSDYSVIVCHDPLSQLAIDVSSYRRIRLPFYIFFLNPVYVATCSLRSVRSNNAARSLRSLRSFYNTTTIKTKEEVKTELTIH